MKAKKDHHEGTFERRPLPSLAQWIGDGARADGFEEWVKEVAASSAALPPDASDDLRASLRIIQTLSIACVEAGRIETERHGRTTAETVILLARCAGFVVMANTAGCARAGVPLGKLRRMLREEFDIGARLLRARAVGDAA